MPFAVGDTDDQVTLSYFDVTGLINEPPPKGDGSGLIVTFVSSDETIITVGKVVSTPGGVMAQLTPIAPGDFIITPTIANISGQPLMDDDGITLFTQPLPISDTVVAPAAQQGPPPVQQAATAVLSLTSNGVITGTASFVVPASQQPPPPPGPSPV